MKDQEKYIINELTTYGSVSRNHCLKMYITRLGAYICDLNKKGWVIKGQWVKYATGKDFVYYVINRPLSPAHSLTYSQIGIE